MKKFSSIDSNHVILFFFILQTPGKVFRGKKMPGRMGGKKTTTPSLKVRVCI